MISSDLNKRTHIVIITTEKHHNDSIDFLPFIRKMIANNENKMITAGYPNIRYVMRPHPTR